MTEKMKKRLAITGACAIGLALVVAIGLRFQKAPGESDILPQPPQSSESVKPEVTTTCGGCTSGFTDSELCGSWGRVSGSPGAF